MLKPSGQDRISSLTSDIVNRSETAINLIEEKLRSQYLLTRNERLGLAVFDLNSDSWLGSVNADASFQTGSMIKLMFACATTIKFPDCLNERNNEFSELRKDIRLMLSKSDNEAANRVLAETGGPQAVQELLSRNFSNIFCSTNICAYIPESGRQYENTASPADFVRTLRALWKNELPASKELLDILKISPRSRFTDYDSDLILPKADVLFHKTGSTARVCCESAIIVPKDHDRPYIISAIVDQEKPAFHTECWITCKEKTLRTISAEVYAVIKELEQIT